MLDVHMAGIVLYNPDIKRLIQNVEAIKTQVNEIVLVDNGSQNINDIKKTLESEDKIYLVENTNNLGIAKALNQIMEIARIRGYNWCLLLDQDSVSAENLISKYNEFLIENNNTLHIGIISPVIIDINSSGRNTHSNIESEYIKKCITSGTLNSVKVWDELQGFDENMFIDGVDHDYCHRMQKSKYRIVRLNSTSIRHEIGKKKYKKIGPIKLSSFNHSPIRKYYITKNIFYMEKKYNNKISMKSYIRVLKQVLYVLLVDDNKVDKIKAISRGIIDGK